jgi:hypothetical protein
MGKRFFSSPVCPDQFLGPPNLPYNEMEILSLGVKHLEHDVNHSPPLTAKVRSKWNYTSIPPHSLIMCKGTTLPYSPILKWEYL